MAEATYVIETTYPIESLPRIRLALLTDSHNKDMTEAVLSLRRNNPDAILIAGDIISGRRPDDPNRLKMDQSEYAMTFLRQCAEIAPTFLSLGNHEWLLNDLDFDAIRSTGVILLDNDYTRIRIREADLVIGGLTSVNVNEYKRYRERERPKELYPVKEVSISAAPELRWLGGFLEEPGYHILMCHQPEYYPKYLKDKPIELICSGHAHGGQWRFFGLGIYAPGQGLFPKLTSGVHDGRLVISRGLANTAPVPRWGNPVEVVYIELAFRQD